VSEGARSLGSACGVLGSDPADPFVAHMEGRVSRGRG
jgi:hypothetical protein